jgi:Pyruvate/2-oxoacid:ferredoxin oxidoreductase delta subunit
VSRVAHRLHDALTPLLGPVSVWASRCRWLGRLPLPPRRYTPPPVWRPAEHDVPDDLKTVAGIWRDSEAEEAAFREGPLYPPTRLYPEVWDWARRVGWSHNIPTFPRRMRALDRQEAVLRSTPDGEPPPADPVALTAEVRTEAARLGLSEVGFAPYDPKYTYGDAGAFETGTVIVCILEQDWEITQAIPSASTEREVLVLYADLLERTCALASFLQARGFRAEPDNYHGEHIVIHYGVQAGLGQLGLNGQLLTPQAGSRCRIGLITTNASLVHGKPRDFGMHAICDKCQLCVRRCPPRAIPKRRNPYRGVTKAKIRLDLCWPTMAQSHGCGVCQKVCPIQRYGLDAVQGHLDATGEILGKGTKELEEYTWIDGHRYGPGQTPTLSKRFLRPDSLPILNDLTRTEPPPRAGQTVNDRGMDP